MELRKRLLDDNAFAVGEVLDENAYGTGLVAVGKHLVLLGTYLNSHLITNNI